jgi:hypothetical protein
MLARSDQATAFVKAGNRHQAAACSVALAGGGPYEFSFHGGALPVGLGGACRRVKAVECLLTSERSMIE